MQILFLIHYEHTLLPKTKTLAPYTMEKNKKVPWKYQIFIGHVANTMVLWNTLEYYKPHDIYKIPVTVWNYWNITATARFIKGQLYATYIRVSVYNECLSTEKSSILSASHEMLFSNCGRLIRSWSDCTTGKHRGNQV